VRALATVDLITYLTFGIIHQNLALATLNETQRKRLPNNKNTNHDSSKRMHRTSANQFKQPTDCTRQARNDACENNDRYAVTNAPFGYLFTQPHEEHSASQQRRDSGQAKQKARVVNQAGLRLERYSNANTLE
jgi:hypothetical protein